MAVDTVTLRSPLSPSGETTPLADLIRRRAAALGDRAYLERPDSDQQYSYLALERAAGTWQLRLRRAGLSCGATVALAIADPLEFSAAFLGIIASGHWAAPLDPEVFDHGVGAVAAAASRVRADFIVTDRPLHDGHGVAGVGLVPSEARGASIFLATTCELPIPEWALSEHGGALLSSSGTTGAPKLIPLHQRQLLHSAIHTARHHRLTRRDRGFSPLPLFHVNAEVVGLLATLLAGSSLVLDNRFHRTGFWETMARQRVTWINAVPAIIARVAELEPDEAVPPGIRFVRSASAPLPPETMRRFESRTGIPILETYGMTEAGGQITANPILGKGKPGSVGLPVGVQLRIVNDIESSVALSGPAGHNPPGKVAAGQVEIRGPSVITAYGEGGNAERFNAGGWLRTGDLGHLDEDGYLYLDGRVDDVINRGGEKVFPREVEEAILFDPAVAAASVVAQPDPVLGQVPVAFLVLHDAGVAADSDAAHLAVARIRDGLGSTLVRAKQPVDFHVVSQLPVGPTGKVRRRELLQRNLAAL